MAKIELLLYVLLIGTGTIYCKTVQEDLASSVIQAEETHIREETQRGLLDDEGDFDDLEADIDDDDLEDGLSGLQERSFEDVPVKMMEVQDVTRQRRSDEAPPCPRRFKRYDINADHMKKFSFVIKPNYNNQDPRWGLEGADHIKNFDFSHLKMKDDDMFILTPKKSARPLLCGRICFSTFVVDKVYITVYNGKTVVGRYSDVPQRTNSWFRPVCTPDMDFVEITKVVFKYDHQPPNFNMKDLHVDACIKKKK